MLSSFYSSLLFNEIEYFTFINLLLVSLFLFYFFLFFFIYSSSLLLSSIYYNDVIIESLITFISLLYVLFIISPGLLLFLDFDLLSSPSFLVYVLGYQWAWSFSLFTPFSSSSSITFEQLILSSSLVSFSLNSSTCLQVPFLISSTSLLSLLTSSGFIMPTTLFSHSFSPSFTPASFYSSFYLSLFNNYLLIPLFTSLSFYVSSFDVIHSFGFHSLGIKSDAIPGRVNYVSSLFLFLPGSLSGFCYELCGIAHTSMSMSLTILV
jgi:heme/copper-type cytochrome/quinol oxidase subunit 2